MEKNYNPQQRIVTIMAAEIVNANGLITNSEDTLQQLLLRRSIFVKFVEVYGGRVFSLSGEKLLAEFSSSHTSLRCALNLQEAIKKINNSLTTPEKLYLRIGLNIGDVAQQNNNLIGHGVNIASHIETLADAGGICLARNVYEQVQPEFNLEYQFQGEKSIQGSGIPVSTFTLSGEESKTNTDLENFTSVFKANPIFQYQLLLIIILSIVIANVIGNLISTPVLSLVVKIITMMMAAFFCFYQYKKLLIPKVEEPRKVFLNHKLIEQTLIKVKSTSSHEFNYKTELDIISTVPTLVVLRFTDTSPEQNQSYFSDGLCKELVNILSKSANLKVSSHRTSLAFDPNTNNPQTFSKSLGVDYYVVGTVDKYTDRLIIHIEVNTVHSDETLWKNGYDCELDDIFTVQDDIIQHIAEALSVNLIPNSDKESLTENTEAYDFYLQGKHYFIQKGIDNIQSAIDMYTMAARLDTKFIRAWTDLAETYAIQAIFYTGGMEAISNSKRIANKGLLLAPERAETYVALGMAHLSNEEHGLAIGRFEKAISINPNLFEAQHNYARTHYLLGNFAEAIRHFEKAAEIENFDFESYALAAPLYTTLGEEKNALDTYQKAYQRVAKYINIYPNNQRAYQLGAIALLKLGQKDKATEWAEQALKLGQDEPATLYNIACFYSLSGDIDKALDCLAKSISSRSWIENDPELDPIRHHPRYKEIIENLEP